MVSFVEVRNYVLILVTTKISSRSFRNVNLVASPSFPELFSVVWPSTRASPTRMFTSEDDDEVEEETDGVNALDHNTIPPLECCKNRLELI